MIQQENKGDLTPEHRKQIGKKLRALREEKGWTQERLSGDTKGDKYTPQVSVKQIQRAESGQTGVSTGALRRIAGALGTNLDNLRSDLKDELVEVSKEPSQISATSDHRVPWSLVVIIFLVLCLIVESVTLVVVMDRHRSRPIVPSNMVLIPAGEFQMGSVDGDDDEKPTHRVYLDAFYIDVCEVTNEDYKRFMDDTGHPAPQYWSDDRFNAPDQPVVGVSWYDAAAYCQWAGRRLPTEAEWEKAARGELVGKKYPWGDSIDPSKANYGKKVGRTTPVGTYPPNGYGLYDMAGNVWEWCMDESDGSFYQKPFDPKNPVSGPFIRFDNQDFTHFTKDHVLRGGCWHNPEGDLRVAQRNGDGSRNTNSLFGFRTARAVGATGGKL